MVVVQPKYKKKRKKEKRTTVRYPLIHF